VCHERNFGRAPGVELEELAANKGIIGLGGGVGGGA
jgi:hypothetical protein